LRLGLVLLFNQKSTISNHKSSCGLLPVAYFH